MADVDLYTWTHPDGTVYHFRDDSGGGNILDKVYPVGSIYMSVNNVSPQTFLGGEWTQIEDTFLLAAGSTYTAGDTGGEATHTLTTSEIPAHTHGSKSLTGGFAVRRTTNANVVQSASSGIVSYTANGWGSTWAGGISQESYSHNPDYVSINATHEHTSVGGSVAHNNMPPYLAVYMWKRTA